MNREAARDRVQTELRESARILQQVAEEHWEFVVDAANLVESSLRNGGTFFTCGNGGSAADAQHIAAELSGRFYIDRPGLAAIALTVNTSALTAIANDYDYDQVFSRQLEGLAGPDDLLLAISTSGGSGSVLAAIETARKAGMKVVGLTGAKGDSFAARCDRALVVPSTNTARIQETHIATGHLLCELVEEALFGDAG